MSGHKIIEGLQDAITGNFRRVTIAGLTFERMDGMKRARNAGAWALGKQHRNGFHVRRVVWGRLLAREEKRDGEIIRRAMIFVGAK